MHKRPCPISVSPYLATKILGPSHVSPGLVGRSLRTESRGHRRHYCRHALHETPHVMAVCPHIQVAIEHCDGPCITVGAVAEASFGKPIEVLASQPGQIQGPWINFNRTDGQETKTQGKYADKTSSEFHDDPPFIRDEYLTNPRKGSLHEKYSECHSTYPTNISGMTTFSIERVKAVKAL